MSNCARHVMQRDCGTIVAAKTVAAGVPVTSSIVECEGFNYMTLHCYVDYTAATALLLTGIWCSNDGSTWEAVTTVAVAAGAGTRTKYSETFTFPAAADQRIIIPVRDLNCKQIKFVFDTTGGTTDTLTVKARLGVL